MIQLRNQCQRRSGKRRLEMQAPHSSTATSFWPFKNSFWAAAPEGTEEWICTSVLIFLCPLALRGLGQLLRGLGQHLKGPGGVGLYRRMHGQTVGWIDVQIPPVFYRTTSPPAPSGAVAAKVRFRRCCCKPPKGVAGHWDIVNRSGKYFPGKKMLQNVQNTIF